jgi:hypothetical protein
MELISTFNSGPVNLGSYVLLQEFCRSQDLSLANWEEVCLVCNFSSTASTSDEQGVEGVVVSGESRVQVFDQFCDSVLHVLSLRIFFIRLMVVCMMRVWLLHVEIVELVAGFFVKSG